jgi:hypothetical protein
VPGRIPGMGIHPPQPNEPPGEICCACGVICEPECGTPAGWPLHICRACRKAIGPGEVVKLQIAAKAGEDFRQFVERFCEGLDEEANRGGAAGFSRN